MDKNVNIKHLFQEAIRKGLIIALAGALMAGFMVLRYVKDVKTQAASVQYGSMSIVEVDDDELAPDNSVIVKNATLKEAVTYMISSDEVINRVIGQLNEDLSPDQVRGMLRFQNDVTGLITKVHVVSPDQEMSQKICSLISVYAVEYLEASGYSAKLLQSAVEMGPVSVSFKDDSNNPEHKYTIVDKVGMPAVSLVSMVKKAIVGFVVGAFLVYALVCLLYLLRGRLVYPEEITENGMKLMAEIRRKHREHDCIDAASNLALELSSQDDENKEITVVRYGSDIDLEDLEKAFTQTGIKTNTIKDVYHYPLEKMLLSDAGNVLFAVKSNTVKAESLKRELEITADLGKKVFGTLFFD